MFLSLGPTTILAATSANKTHEAEVLEMDLGVKVVLDCNCIIYCCIVQCTFYSRVDNDTSDSSLMWRKGEKELESRAGLLYIPMLKRDQAMSMYSSGGYTYIIVAMYSS